MLMTPLLRKLVIVAAILSPVPASAEFRQGRDGVPVCTAPSFQGHPVIVGDGSGGAFIAWTDLRNGREDIFAQHILPSGGVDPKWPGDGLAVCTANGRQSNQRMVADGSGGAIIAWTDRRVSSSYGSADIYAQRILRSGVVDPAWPKDGRAVCTAAGDQEFPELTAGGSGGAIVVWLDSRDGVSDVYAQRILTTGVSDPMWPSGGLAVCTASGGQSEVRIVNDDDAGAIIAWTDERDDLYDIYAHHVLVEGAVDGAWPANGRAVCTAPEFQGNPTLVEDGKGGAILAWADARTGTFPWYSGYWDIYATHLLASGILDPAWPVDGQALCTAVRDQVFPVLIRDGGDGAIAAWTDGRGLHLGFYGQHVLSSGKVDPNWPTDGAALCTSAPRFDLAMVEDGFGGAILAWEDQRGSGSDVYAQHIRTSGDLYRGWPKDGSAVCASGGDQVEVAIAGVGSGHAIVAWRDQRNSVDGDIYASRIRGHIAVGQSPTASVERPSIGAFQPMSSRDDEVAITFDLSGPAEVTVELFDLAGRAIRTLVAHEGLEAGVHSLAWDGSGRDGSPLRRGVYLVRISAGRESVTGKLLKLR